MARRSVPDDHGHDDHDDHDHVSVQHDHPHREQSGLRGALKSLFGTHTHDPADSIDDALAASARGIWAVKLSLAGLGVTAAIQFIVVAASGSVALLADSIHNVSDALTAVPLWIAFAFGRRPATRRYTYGYGRAEDIAGILAGSLLPESSGFSGTKPWRSSASVSEGRSAPPRSSRTVCTRAPTV